MSYEGKPTQRSSTQQSLVTDADATVRRELPSVAGAALTVPKAGADDAWRTLPKEQGVARFWLDGRFKASADEAGGTAWKVGGGVAQIGARPPGPPDTTARASRSPSWTPVSTPSTRTSPRW
ncbi:hypothetical protein ABZ646_08870 [Streptomyces sp. NPDC007162]|uniref:hypothetical protein n=1 Tax=Streptomyces sp. NPDC007162 TaxID=3156917 RepID=UPI0033CC64E8